MVLNVLALSDWAYQRLLLAYPRTFRRQYEAEMVQVFRTCCRIAYRTAGFGGVLQLWPPTLWDWAWTATRERISNLFNGRYDMSDTLALDRQLGDMVWSVTVALRSGFSVRQGMEMIAQEGPEPTASMCRQMIQDLDKGLSFDQVWADLKATWPSPYMTRIVETMQEQLRVGGNLATLLDPLVQEIRQTAGSDGAFYPAMREQARQLGAQLPEYARLPDSPDSA